MGYISANKVINKPLTPTITSISNQAGSFMAWLLTGCLEYNLFTLEANSNANLGSI